MAKEYIEREAAKARLRMWITDCVLDGDNEAADCFRDCIDLLDSIPAADVIEKKHGYWIKRIIENEKRIIQYEMWIIFVQDAKAAGMSR